MRVSLLPHRNDWTEIQRDAVTMLECTSGIAGVGGTATWSGSRSPSSTSSVGCERPAPGGVGEITPAKSWRPSWRWSS